MFALISLESCQLYLINDTKNKILLLQYFMFLKYLRDNDLKRRSPVISSLELLIAPTESLDATASCYVHPTEGWWDFVLVQIQSASVSATLRGFFLL